MNENKKGSKAKRVILNVLKSIIGLLTLLVAAVTFNVSRIVIQTQRSPCISLDFMTIFMENEPEIADEFERAYYKTRTLCMSAQINEFLASRKINEKGLWLDFDVSSHSNVFELYLASASNSDNKPLLAQRRKTVVGFKNLSVDIKNIKVKDIKITYSDSTDNDATQKLELQLNNIKPEVTFSKTVAGGESFYMALTEIYTDPKYLLCKTVPHGQEDLMNYDEIRITFDVENIYGKIFSYESVFKYNGYSTAFDMRLIGSFWAETGRWLGFV
jgi:hypothetical protein